jgi:hypothetical protein
LALFKDGSRNTDKKKDEQEKHTKEKHSLKVEILGKIIPQKKI